MDNFSTENRIVVEGYLKDNTLDVATGKQGDYIGGNITVATTDGMEYTLRYYSAKLKKDGTENKMYSSLLEAQKSKTTTCAHLLETGAARSMEEAKRSATLVRCTGEMREDFWKGKDGEIHTAVRLRGISIRLLAGVDSFKPKAEFKVDAYLAGVRPEIKNEEETGRAVVEAILPTYGGGASKINFIAPQENGIADYILGNFVVGGTYSIWGDLVKLRKETVQETPAVASFGRKEEPRVTVEFIDERIIVGGATMPYEEDDKRYMSQKEMTERLVKREEEMEEVKKATAPEGRGSFGAPSNGAPQRPAPAATADNSRFQNIDF